MQTDRLTTMRILWAALLSSVAVYAGIVVATGKAEPATPAPDPMMIVVMSGAALMTAVMSFVLPPIVFRKAALTNNAPTDDGAPLPESREQRAAREQVTSAAAGVLRDPAAAEAAAFRHYQTRMILELALSESVALFGLILAFMGFGLYRAAPLFAAAAVLMLLRFPTRDRVLSAYEEAVGARFPGSTR